MEESVIAYSSEIAQLKDRFEDGELSQLDVSRHGALLAEWNESRRFIERGKLSDVRDLQVFGRISAVQREHLTYLADYYRCKHETLARLGCAIFYVDAKRAVYAKYGDASLLDSLKRVGIRTGTAFTLQNLGHTIADDAEGLPFQTVRRIGAEQYADVFAPYVCMARFAKGSPYGYRGTSIVFVPLERYTADIGIMVENILEQEDISYHNKIFYPYTHARSELLEKSAALGGETFLLSDAQGAVVYTSPEFDRVLGRGVGAYDAERSSLTDFVPALAPVWDSLQAGRPVTARSVSIGRGTERQGFFVDGFAIRENGELLGYKISLRTLTQINRHATPLLGSAVVYSFASIIGSSEQITRCKEVAFQAAKSDSNVLITGESGTGKELFAQAIHQASGRAGKPFVAVNCGALPKELIGSELFGYEEGAFTGAKRGGHVGKAEQADGGTLFLDEIGEMPLDVQVFLLRFLDGGEITRIGAKKAIPVDVRIIAATNRNLAECTRSGTFRLDLYYRLNVLRISLPPLREREGDMRELLPYFLDSISKRLGKSVTVASPAVLNLFERRPWPGNLRELRNVVERCVNLLPEGVTELDLPYLPEDLLADGNPQEAAAGVERDAQEAGTRRVRAAAADSGVFDSAGRSGGASASAATSGEPFDYRAYEKGLIERALIEHRGNKKAVAQALGMSRTTLYQRLRDYGINA